MEISSIDTDKNSNNNYYAWVKIKDGYILEVYEETGREGGTIWSNKYPKQNGGLKECLRSQARDWPNFYAKVVSKAYKEKLPSLRIVQQEHKKYDIDLLDQEMDNLTKQLNKKKKEKMKVLRRWCD